jgi:putative nucleotidyltransferase with HDIG domain
MVIGKETTAEKNTTPQVQSRRILLVDDDYYFRTVLEKSLAHHGYSPTCAENAKHAQQVLSLEEFDIVISDIRMPGMTGIELLDWIKKNHPLPVVLMTGFAEILETQEGAQLGADAFLAKPFKTEELLKAIESCFKKTETVEEEKNLDPDFCKIGIEDFVSGNEMKFDIYVRITERKYIKVAHSGENIPLERIQVYQGKGIQFLYMLKEDFKKYLNFNLIMVDAVTQSQKIDHQKKIAFVKHTTEVLLQNLRVNEIKEEDFMQASALVENSIKLLNDSADATNLLAALAGHTDHLYAHSVGVSLYSSMIGRKLGWRSASTVSKLSIGGLLHDVGKKEIPREILNKTRSELSAEEISLLESHPVRGAEILAQLQCVPSDVLQIVHEHHENCLGFGYPSHLKKSKIHPLAKVVALANEFCNFVIKNPNSPGLKPGDAIQRLISLNPEYYDEAALQALMKLFNIL